MLFALIIIVLCIWFYTRGMNIAGIILFFVIGILVSAATGTALGTVKLSGKVMADSASVVGLLLDLVKQTRSDLSGLRQKQAASGTALSDLLKGLSFVVVIPAVAELIQNHLRLLAKPVKFLAENALFYLTQTLADTVDQATRKIPAAQLTAPGEQKSAGFDQAIDEARGKIDRLAQGRLDLLHRYPGSHRGGQQRLTRDQRQCPGGGTANLRLRRQCRDLRHPSGNFKF